MRTAPDSAQTAAGAAVDRRVLAVGCVLALAVPYALSDSNVVQAATLAAAALIAAASVVRSLSRASLLRSWPWNALAAGWVLYSVATVFWSFGQRVYPLPFPSAADVALLVTYLLWCAFLVGVAASDSRAERGRRAALSLVDAAIFTCVGLAVVWPGVIVAYLLDPGSGTAATAVGIGYPVTLAFLFGLAAHVALSGAARGVPGALLLLWISAEVTSAVPYSFLAVDGVVAVGHPSSLAWFVSYAAVAALALHPRLRTVVSGRAAPQERHLRRNWVLLVGPLAPVVVRAVAAERAPDELHPFTELGLLGLTVLVLVLVLARLQLVSGDLARQRRLSRELEVAASALAEQRDRLAVHAAVAESTDDSIVVTSLDGTIRAWNGGAERLYGYTREEAIGRSISLIMSPEQRDRYRELGQSLSDEPHVRFESMDLRKDGERVLTAVTLSVVRSEEGEPTALVGIARDITEQKRALERERDQAKQLAHLAFHDPLTGLANRALLSDRLAHALVLREQTPLSLLLLDLDDFKSVNDASGHAAGDQLLVEVARRLLTCVRAEDTVGRLGGDEFAVLVEDGDGGEAAERILRELSRSVVIGDRSVVPIASIGVARSQRGSDPTTLMLQADVAMYAAKAAGKGQVVHFDPAMGDVVRHRAQLQAELRLAVRRGEMVVHYQPIIDAHAGAASRVEALVRWQRPEGLVLPHEFLPAAEQTGLIVEIGHEVLRQACQGLSHWLDEDPRRSVAVNVSARQLAEDGFAGEVRRVLDDHGVRPTQLVLEVTETMFLDATAGVVDQLVALRDIGVRISIDDFGTGYSSLGRLQSLPVDSVKIDKSFVDLIVEGHDDLPILTAMMLMSHSLGLEVTAEGVETLRQAEHLLALGCDYLQGHYFARAEPARQALTSTCDAAESAFSAIVRRHVSGRTVLLVDADAATRGVARVTLVPAGFDVQEATTGAEGLVLAEQLAPDCILVDLDLPDMPGLELVQALRARPELGSTAIVVLAGAAQREVGGAACSSGADDCIVKPLLPEHLSAQLDTAISGKVPNPRAAPPDDR